MLILTRRCGESVMIDDDTEITILGIKGSQTRIGIAAPKSTTVHRKEIYEKIQVEKDQEKQQADG